MKDVSLGKISQLGMSELKRLNLKYYASTFYIYYTCKLEKKCAGVSGVKTGVCNRKHVNICNIPSKSDFSNIKHVKYDEKN